MNLKNPSLRKVLAPRVSIRDAARIGKCEIEELYKALEAVGFEAEREKIEVDEKLPEVNQDIDLAIRESRKITLDVRPILETGRDPFEHIMDAFSDLDPGQALEVVNSFEPTPLIKIMEEKGVSSYVKEEGDIVLTYFLKPLSEVSAELKDTYHNMLCAEEMDALKKRFEGKLKEIDVRHLEMPEPMVTILSELENLGESEALFVNHKKVPQYLLPELEDRKFSVNVLDVEEGKVYLLIHK